MITGCYADGGACGGRGFLPGFSSRHYSIGLPSREHRALCCSCSRADSVKYGMVCGPVFWGCFLLLDHVPAL